MTDEGRAAVVEHVYQDVIVGSGLITAWDLAQIVPGPNASLEQLWAFCGPELEEGS